MIMSNVSAVSVVTRNDLYAAVANEFNNSNNKNIKEEKVEQLFKMFRGNTSHGSFMNMRRTYIMYAVNSEGVRTDAEYVYSDAATGGAYPTGRLVLNKGIRQLPNDWNEVRIEIYAHRNNGDWARNGSFLIAEKNNNGSVIAYAIPTM